MENKAKIETVEPGLFAGTIAEEIVASIQESIEERGRATVVLAGGSTPSAVYRLLSRPPFVDEVPWEDVYFFWGDEKWPVEENAKTNYRMVSETLLSHRRSPEENLFTVDTTLSDPDEAARKYDAAIRDFFGADEPVFDIVLLGIGTDGHIASAFPKTGAVHEEKALACAIDHNCPRVTLTPHILFNGRHILFMAKGKDKADIVRRVLQDRDSSLDLPAAQFEGAAERVTWFLCSEAASELNLK